MSSRRLRVAITLLLVALAPQPRASAHIGSPDIFVEGAFHDQLPAYRASLAVPASYWCGV